MKHTVTVAIIAGSLIASLSCKSNSAHNTAAPPPPSVVVAEVSQKTVPIYSEYVGQTRADNTVELRARVEGLLQKVYFREGAPVKKGQLLFTIDKRPFQAALQSANPFQIWPRRSNALTSSRRKLSWRTRRRC
jgi:membrane fusion protein (multidrug efflux system)